MKNLINECTSIASKYLSPLLPADATQQPLQAGTSPVKGEAHLWRLTSHLLLSGGFHPAPYKSGLTLKKILSSGKAEALKATVGKSGAGFTIIELLVVLTLIGFVSGIGIFSLVNYGNNQSIEQAAKSVKSIFDEAKFNAVSSVKFETDSSGNSVSCNDNLVSYIVDVVISATQGIPDKMTLTMACESSTILIKTYNLPENLSFAVGTSCDTISYEVVNVSVSAFPVLPCEVIIEGLNQTKTITVDSLGNANIN